MAKGRFYFDHAATTPLDPAVLRAMKPYFTDDFGNPSNLYGFGRKAKAAIAAAAKKISAALGCAPSEFIFTGSATESDNMAIAGVARANRRTGGNGAAGGAGKIIVSNVEHKGILSVCDALREEGFEIEYLKVGRDGLVNPRDLTKMLGEKTILVSVTYADSETGTIQPIAELAKVIKKFRAKTKSALPYFHTDASQAAAYLDINVQKLGVDLLTLSAHKLYGPKGVGGLYVRRGVRMVPIIYGGGQQDRLRSGTENVPAIVGFGEAVALAAKHRKTEAARVKNLRDALQKGISKKIPKVVLNGHPTKRLPNFLNISILDIEGEALLLYLDELGIMVNTGSACNSESLEPSYVLMALGNPYEYAHGSARFTLGKGTTPAAVNYVLKHLPEVVVKLRNISPLNLKLGEKKITSQPKAFIGGQTPHFLRKKQRG
ncbi:MAG: aminotransferase class V-fold PLP-dependent enzyme [Minisyncoccia bacterium]|jgi:cysteine desulfurase